MKTKVWVQAVILLLAVGLLGGCATKKIDWNSRVGVYNYDQAITDMGPPDRVAKLTDETVVAEWLTSRGRDYNSYWLYGPYYYHPVYEPGLPDRFIRLTFAPDGKLKDWKKVSR